MKNVGTVTALSTLRGLGYSSIWIYSAIYLRVNLNLSILQDGLILTLGSAIAAFVQIYAGILADRFGYKRFIVLSVAICSVLFGLLVGSQGIRDSVLYYPIVFIGLMIANSAQAPATNAIISESSSVKLKGFPILRIGNNIGWGIGPALGGFLILGGSFYYLFLFGFATTLAGLLLSLTLKEIKPEGARAVQFHAGNRLLIILSVVALLLFIVQAQETITLSNYAKIIRNLNFNEIGLVYLTNGIVVIATQGFIYKLARRIGNYYSYVIGGILYSFGFFSYAFFSTLPGFMLATVILTIGENFSFPAGSAMVSLVSKPENIGRNMGTYNAFISAGRAIGPLIGGTVMSLTSNSYELWALTTVWGFISVLVFVGAFWNKSGVAKQLSESVTQ